jgi:hypothetical protein
VPTTTTTLPDTGTGISDGPTTGTTWPLATALTLLLVAAGAAAAARRRIVPVRVPQDR